LLIGTVSRSSSGQSCGSRAPVSRQDHGMPALSADTPLTWSLVVPVKVLARAKSRLALLAGPDRPALALAMAADTVAAALACPEVSRVIVVTDDSRAASVLAGLGAIVVAERADQGLNPALRHGARHAGARWPRSGVGALAADLPALRPGELGAALRLAAGWPQAFVPDASGSGTTLYTVHPGTAFRPRFGPSSAARHRAAGAVELTHPGLASLRRDVDEPADLRGAGDLGLGTRTAAIAARLVGRADDAGARECGRFGS
jgi:2-phospho-L-lactate/phosphoenolpyruvate guanylyltransferase